MAQTDGTFRHYPPQTRYLSKSVPRFMFATGIECSYPTIDTPQGRLRRDQMEECGHYERWREDFDLVRQIGCRYLRYGPPLHRVHFGPGRYDWSFTDEVLPVLREQGIEPIIDLCHFGVPDWIGDFQNADFPGLFAEYARAFAERYPWIRLFTPVNEMYITSQFSGYYGWWNECLASHRGFVGAIKNVTRASVQAMLAILETRPDALFVLCESSEHTHCRKPEHKDEALFYNERRFVALDLTCGRRTSAGMYAYLLDHGMTDEEYGFFLRQDLRKRLIIGHDYYPTNEQVLVEPHVREAAGAVLGYDSIARQYHGRYHLPVMHTETNVVGEGAADWVWAIWTNIQQLRHDGLPVCGMTWYSLTDQIDWDVALREKNDRPHPVGLFDLDRRIRPVGKAYKELIELWSEEPMVPDGPLTVLGMHRPDESC